MGEGGVTSFSIEGTPMQVTVTDRATTMSAEQKQRATQRMESLESIAPGPVLGAHVRMERDDNPRIPRPVHAQGEIDVNGHIVRAHVAGESTDQALDGLVDHLERQLRRVAERFVTRRRENAEADEGTWRHGDIPADRPSFFPRPTEEREVVRQKTFGLEPMTPVEAAADMVDLDHEFYLFRDAATGQDAVIHRLREDGRMGLVVHPDSDPDVDDRWLAVEPNRFSEPVALRTALAEMDAVGHRFLYFVNQESGRGNVIYLRYDGHYGLIEPA